MIWLRVFMFVLAIYYIMLIFQVITGVTWTAKRVTFLRFIIPFYFWITINSSDVTEIAVDTETEGMDPKFNNEFKRNIDNNIYVKYKGKWISETEYKEIINKKK